MKAFTWLSGSAPMKPSTGWPLTNAMTAGIDWMPSWPGIAGCSSMFILTSLTLPLAALHRLFEHGRELLAGPAPRRPEIDQHRLGFGFLDDVFDEVCVVVSLMRPSAAARRRYLAVLQHCPPILA